MCYVLICVFAFDKCMYIHTKHCLIQPHTHTHTHTHTHFLFLSLSSLPSTVATTQTIQIILAQTVWSHPCTHTHTLFSPATPPSHTHTVTSQPHTQTFWYTHRRKHTAPSHLFTAPPLHCTSPSPLRLCVVWTGLRIFLNCEIIK